MPLFYQYNINETTKLAVWHIVEDEKFFLNKVSVQREITHPHKRLQHLAGRYLLRHVFPDFPSHLIEIADTLKPYLDDEAYHFSISHSGDYAAVIVSTEQRVGIDVEMITTKAERVKHKFLSVEELRRVNQSSFTLHQHLTILWSVKEAVYKWYGAGDVDFREDIVLHNLHLRDEGHLQCSFVKAEELQLQVRYRSFDDTISLAWIMS